MTTSPGPFDEIDLFRRPDGSFRPYTHPLGTTIHGDQFIPPWHIPGRGNYVIDDFGDWNCRQHHWMEGAGECH